MNRPGASSLRALGHDLLAVAVLLVFAGAGGAMLVRHRHATRPFHPAVTLAEMRAYVTAGDTLILDARNRDDYAAGHIPGAESLPVAEWKHRAVELNAVLRRHRNRLVVVYCGDAWCGLAEELQQALADLGHKRVGQFSAGFNAWREAGLATERAP